MAASKPRGVPKRLGEGIGALDRKQRLAVMAKGNLVITAGPGSGKTKTIVARAGWLLSTQISPLRGLATITYTNQAAAELSEGLARLGVVASDRLFAGTLHAFCLAQVVSFAPLVGVELPGLDKLMTSEQAKELEQESADAVGVNVWALREVFPSLRRRIAAGEKVDEDDSNVRAVQHYERLCKRRGVWDFEGIVLDSVRLLETHPEISDVIQAKFPVVMIDEYQDLGAGLHRLVELLIAAGVEISAVGDVDQSIYGFAGGDPAYLNALCSRHDFTVRKLTINYRCGSAVVKAAEHTLDVVRGYRADPRRSDPGVLEFHVVEGSLSTQARHVADAVREFLAAGVAPHEIAILLRNRMPLAPLIEHELSATGLLVQHSNLKVGPSTELGKWLEAAAMYAVRMAPNAAGSTPPEHGASELLRRLEIFRRRADLWSPGDQYIVQLTELHDVLTGGGPRPDLTVAEWLRQVAGAFNLHEIAKGIGDPRSSSELLGLIDTPTTVALAELASDTSGTGRIVITTFHGAKGRTFSAVVIPGLTEGVVPPWTGPTSRQRPLTGAKLAEEKRSFYVALTRSRGSVLLQLSSTGIDTRGNSISRGYSRFAQQLAASLGAPVKVID